jgi:DNA-binding NarL/FixJ family response regulator
VAVVDADRRVQQSIADVLRVAGVDVVGTAGDPGGALELIGRTQPSMVLVDPRLPDLHAGEALMRTLSEQHPGVRVVLMGWNAPAESRLAAAVFVPKSAPAEDFVAAALEACQP